MHQVSLIKNGRDAANIDIILEEWLPFSEYTPSEVYFTLRQLDVHWDELVFLVEYATRNFLSQSPNTHSSVPCWVVNEVIRRLVQNMESEVFHHQKYYALSTDEKRKVILDQVFDLSFKDDILFCSKISVQPETHYELPTDLRYWISMFGFSVCCPPLIQAMVQLRESLENRLVSITSQLKMVDLPFSKDANESSCIPIEIHRENRVMNFNPKSSAKFYFLKDDSNSSDRKCSCDLSENTDISEYLPIIRNYRHIGYIFDDGADVPSEDHESLQKLKSETMIEAYMTLFINIAVESKHYGKILAHLRSPSAPLNFYGWSFVCDSWTELIQLFNDWMVISRMIRISAGSEKFICKPLDRSELFNPPANDLDIDMEQSMDTGDLDLSQARQTATEKLLDFAKNAEKSQKNSFAEKIYIFCENFKENWWEQTSETLVDFLCYFSSMQKNFV